MLGVGLAMSAVPARSGVAGGLGPARRESSTAVSTSLNSPSGSAELGARLVLSASAGFGSLFGGRGYSLICVCSI